MMSHDEVSFMSLKLFEFQRNQEGVQRFHKQQWRHHFWASVGISQVIWLKKANLPWAFRFPDWALSPPPFAKWRASKEASKGQISSVPSGPEIHTGQHGLSKKPDFESWHSHLATAKYYKEIPSCLWALVYLSTRWKGDLLTRGPGRSLPADGERGKTAAASVDGTTWLSRVMWPCSLFAASPSSEGFPLEHNGWEGKHIS